MSYCHGFLGYVTNLESFFQHSLLYRKENAHDDSIWSCAWGRMKKKDDENGDGEGSRYTVLICHNPDSQVRINVYATTAYHFSDVVHFCCGHNEFENNRLP